MTHKRHAISFSRWGPKATDDPLEEVENRIKESFLDGRYGDD
jgi:hypothetical protein